MYDTVVAVFSTFSWGIVNLISPAFDLVDWSLNLPITNIVSRERQLFSEGWFAGVFHLF
jgi:hypothetical protein